ncbi:protein of unknown function (plasmid) [Methylocella tundrae]|uniref:Uncharacterized protein n=1 Tax=Methylocella tundrae TaxID=227605 RepID=A0A4U8Z7M0_METTU|nr:protein of unknown function [Methylocella tundrae]
MLLKHRSNRRAYRLARLSRLARLFRSALWLWLRLGRLFCPSRRWLFESLQLTFGNTQVDDLRLKFSDFFADAFECSVH